MNRTAPSGAIRLVGQDFSNSTENGTTIGEMVREGIKRAQDKLIDLSMRCQSALDRDPVSASKRDPLVLRFERLAIAPSELAGIAETGRARVDV